MVGGARGPRPNKPTRTSRMNEDPMIHWNDRIRDSTSAVNGSATATAIETSVSAH